jgi:hypothetical protein
VPEPPATPSLPADRAPSVELKVEPDEVAVGELIEWRAEVRRRVGDRVHLPGGADFGDLEVQGKDREVGEATDDWVVETLEVRLIPFEAGEFEIPAQQLTVVDIEGRIAEIEAPAKAVRVKSLIANEPEPELKPDSGPGVRVFEEDYTPLYVLAVIGGALLIALLTLIGRRLWALRRPRPGPPPPPPRPAEEIALEKLEALRAANYLDLGQHKLFHITLSEAFREYLGNRYRFDSLERATEELRWELRRLGLPRPLFERMIGLLEETDLVKFAKLIPTIGDSEGMLSEAFALVRETTPKPAPTAAPPSADGEAPAAHPPTDGPKGGDADG